MITYRGSFIFFASVVLLASNRAQATLSFALKPEHILPGERAVLEIRLPEKDLVRAEKSDPDEAPVQQDDLLVQSTHFQLLEQDYRKENGNYVWRYELTSYEIGKLMIPPVEIRLGPQTFSSESVGLEVTNPREASDRDMRPEFGPVSPHLPWGRWLLGAALVSALTYLVYRLKGKFRSVQPDVVVATPAENDEDWLRRRLQELKRLLEPAEQKAQNSVTVIDRLAAILREYFSRKIFKPVTSWTTRQIKSELSEEWATGLSPWFERSDEWKFTGNRTEGAAVDIAQTGIETSEATLLKRGIPTFPKGGEK